MTALASDALAPDGRNLRKSGISENPESPKSGISEIRNLRLFRMGPRSSTPPLSSTPAPQISFSAPKADQSKSSQVAVVITAVDGNQASCS